MEECIFCKIVRADIPSYKIYEDDYTLAFLDIAPVSKGHTLVIPKKHYANFEDIPEEELCALIKTVKKIGGMLKEGLGVFGYNMQVNNDPIVGQIIPHIHFHLIPRKEGDGLQLWPQGGYDPGEAEKIAEKIRKD
jgi:histidine triad (HIT) family protein